MQELIRQRILWLVYTCFLLGHLHLKMESARGLGTFSLAGFYPLKGKSAQYFYGLILPVYGNFRPADSSPRDEKCVAPCLTEKSQPVDLSAC
jgi:hypothetical protein